MTKARPGARGGRDDWRFWWRAWVATQSSTRVQMTNALMLVFLAASFKTISRIASVMDGVAVLQVLIPVLLIAAGWHMSGKGLETLKEIRANGKQAPHG